MPDDARLHTDLALKRIEDAARIVGGHATLAQLAGVHVDVSRRMARKKPEIIEKMAKLEQAAVDVLVKNRGEA